MGVNDTFATDASASTESKIDKKSTIELYSSSEESSTPSAILHALNSKTGKTNLGDRLEYYCSDDDEEDDDYDS
jgi:hypothetical protein